MSEQDDTKPPETPGEESEEEAKTEPSAEDEAAAAKAKAEAKAKALAAAKAKKAAEEAAKPAWERDPVAPAIEDASSDPLVAALAKANPEAVTKAIRRGDELTLDVQRSSIRKVCESFKKESFLLLVDICGADFLDQKGREGERFEVLYHLYSIKKNQRIRLRVEVGEDVEVPSVTSVWRGADWCEREVYDMYGVRFSEHPDMTRILLWEGFNGHPLRKDFPVEGIDTGAAIYPEYYEEEAGPIIGTGTGWKPPEPPAVAEPPAEGEAEKDEGADA